MGVTNGRGIRCGPAAAVLALWGLAAGAVAADAAAPAFTRLLPGQERDAAVTAGGQAGYRIDLPAGRAAQLVIRQRDATLRVTRADAPVPAYQNDAGRGAVVRLTLIADTRIVIKVKNDAAATFQVRLGTPHPVTAQDRDRAEAERLLADAEEQRRALGSLEAGNPGAESMAAAARERYAQAVAQAHTAGDACGLVMAQAGLARLAFARGDYAASAAAAQAALASRCDDRDDVAAGAETAVAERTLGSALGYRGDLVGGTAASERALALYRRTGDPNYQAMVLGNLSANYRVLGESHKALATAQATLAAAERIGDRRRAAFARHGMAAIRFTRGELAPALALYREALASLADAPYPLVEAMCWNDLGLLYGKLGDVTAADDAFARAAQVWRASGDDAGLAETELNMADARHERGDVDGAAEGYRRALAFDESHGFKREQTRALYGLGRVATTQGRWNEARERFAAARDLAAAIPAPIIEASTHLALGDVDARQGRLAAAREEYERGLALSRQAADRASEAASLASLARAAHAERRDDEAKAQIEAALAIVEDQRAAIAEPGLRTSFLASQQSYYELHVDVLLRLHAREPRRGYAAMALAASERARARALRDRYAERRVDLESTVDASLLAAETAAQDALQRLAWRAAQADDATRADLQAQTDAAARDLDRARGALRAAYPGYAALLDPAPIAPGDLQRDLFDAGSAALVYHLGESRSAGWLLTRDGVETFALPPRATLEAEVTALRERLLAPAAPAAAGDITQAAARDAGDEAAIRATARKLARWLLPPAARGRRTLVVVADGELQHLPFALLDMDNAMSGRHDFVYTPSLAALRGLRDATRGVGTRVAVWADPVFRADDERLAGRSAVASDTALALRAAREAGLGTLARLPNTREEAQSVAELAAAREPRVSLDFAASRDDALATDWSRYGIVHFATHALVNARHPELSGVVLSLYGADGRASDGFLRANDIYRLRMPVDLVVLSACNAASGPDIGAEGAFSLSRAFFYAGARRVLASLWAVDDRATAQFMRHYYRALVADAQTPSRALTAAQAAMRADPRWRAPFWWAGFVLQGDFAP